jgi:hypothetical protein
MLCRACLCYFSSQRNLTAQAYFLVFISSIGSFLALASLFLTLAFTFRDVLVVAAVMFTAILCELAFVYCVAKYKLTWPRAFFVVIGVLSFLSIFLLVNPATNRFILSSIGFRSAGPVAILMEAKTASAFSNIPDVTTEARGEYLLIKNVGIAFRSGSQTIVEAPYPKSSDPAKGNQLISIKSDDIKAISQNAQVISE